MATGPHPFTLGQQVSRSARSLLFFVPYLLYLALVTEPLQWLVLWPLVKLMPARRRAIMRAWLRGQLHVMLGVSRAMAGFRVSVRGAIPPESCIVLMNHQSVLDVVIGLSLVPGPLPVIPTRARYRRGVPGVSTLMALAGFPFVSERETTTRAELRSLVAAADAVARGEQSVLIFPEGHRSRNGRILPFMPAGLRQVFKHAPHRPVYLVVAEGLGHLGSIAETALRIAGTTARVTVLGPYTIPAGAGRVGPFIESLRERMIGARAEDPPPDLSPLPHAADRRRLR